MIILAPLKITDPMLLASTVPEDDAQEWTTTDSYEIGQKVLRKHLHRVYHAKTQNSGKQPEDNPEDWHCLGASNRWAVFDEKIGTATTAQGEMTITLRPGQPVPGLALVGVSANSVQVHISDEQYGEMFDQTISMHSVMAVADWWHYFFGSRVRRTSWEHLALPASVGAKITITLRDEPDQTVRCGAILLGDVVQFARAARPGARMGIIDYSYKSADEWGNHEIVERSYAKSARWNILVPGRQADRLFDLLTSLRARPALYIGGNFGGLKVYGFFKEFDVVVEYDRLLDCSIELEGLI